MGQCLNKEPSAVVFSTPDLNASSSTLQAATPVEEEAKTDETPPADSKLDPGMSSKSQLLAQASTPSAIDTSQLTTIYRVPDDKYAKPEDVLKDRGIQLLDMFDEGGFAKVFKARRMSQPNKLMACKMVDIGNDLSDNAKLSDVKNELFVLEKVKHPHLVKLWEHFIINEKLYNVHFHGLRRLWQPVSLHVQSPRPDERGRSQETIFANCEWRCVHAC